MIETICISIMIGLVCFLLYLCGYKKGHSRGLHDGRMEVMKAR